LTRSQAWLDGRRLLWLGSAIFVLLGTAIELGSSYALIDFKAIYYGARCVILHHDPYSESQFLSVYESESGTFPSDPVAARSVRQAVPVCINLPTALFVISPLAALPWRAAAALWILATAASLILAAFLVWQIAADFAPRIAAGLAFLVLAGSQLLLVVGNASGVVVGLCVIAVCSFLREKFVPAGIACLALGLLIKPHDAILVWIYFLLAGGIYRRRALLVALLAAAVAVPAVFWVMHVSPHWLQGLHANIASESVRGGLNDPGPTSMGSHGLGMDVSLQAALSLIRDDPRFYDPAAWLIGGALFLAWSYKILRARFSPRSAFLALAAASALTMLPVYHRSYDARLLLLVIPACAVLWVEGRFIKWCAFLIPAIAILSTSDLFSAILLILIKNLSALFSALPAAIVTAIQVLPAPFSLLAVCVFYLSVPLESTAAGAAGASRK
jgi:Glycosyltransferase family 87